MIKIKCEYPTAKIKEAERKKTDEFIRLLVKTLNKDVNKLKRRIKWQKIQRKENKPVAL